MWHVCASLNAHRTSGTWHRATCSRLLCVRPTTTAAACMAGGWRVCGGAWSCSFRCVRCNLLHEQSRGCSSLEAKGDRMMTLCCRRQERREQAQACKPCQVQPVALPVQWVMLKHKACCYKLKYRGRLQVVRAKQVMNRQQNRGGRLRVKPARCQASTQFRKNGRLYHKCWTSLPLDLLYIPYM